MNALRIGRMVIVVPSCCQCSEPAVREHDGWKFCADHLHANEIGAV